MTSAEVNPDDFKWELYNINEDFSQANNLVEKYPEKLKELQDAFEVEAKKYNVYPLDSSFTARFNPAIRPSLSRGRTKFVYYPGMVRIPEGSAPDFKNKSWTVAAEITVPKEGASGVLATIGGRFGGWGLWLDRSTPHFAYALSNQPTNKFRMASKEAIGPGQHLCASHSSTQVVAWAKVERPRCWWMKKKLRRLPFPRRCRHDSPWTKPSTSAPTPGRRSSRTMSTRCRTRSQERSRSLGSYWSRSN